MKKPLVFTAINIMVCHEFVCHTFTVISSMLTFTTRYWSMWFRIYISANVKHGLGQWFPSGGLWMPRSPQKDFLGVVHDLCIYIWKHPIVQKAKKYSGNWPQNKKHQKMRSKCFHKKLHMVKWKEVVSCGNSQLDSS